MVSKTNIELVAHCKKALQEGWHYLWGTYGQQATQTLLNSNIGQYPDNERWRAYATKAIAKTRFCDCYGLVKGFLWWTTDNSNPKYAAAQDVNTTTAYNRAVTKGLLSTLPELPGVILWMQGHVGVYIGNGDFIECAGGGKGMVKGRIQNGKIVSGSKFTHWFRDINIEYIDVIVVKEDDKVDKTKIKIDGKVYEINRIFKGDKNYVELQSLTQAGFKIDYDAVNKMPVITSPGK